MATMTLLGLYSYNPNLFELLSVPDGIDKGILVDNILTRSADFEVLYSDPDFVHDSLRIWSAKWHRTFERWLKALSVDYDPLSNYDRKEEWTDDNKGQSTVKGTTKDQSSITTDRSISAYNSSTLQPQDKQVTGSNSESSLDNVNTSENNNVRKGRAWGNIGVTTSQQMLEAELTVAEWNLYDHITDIFLSEFVIPVFD